MKGGMGGGEEENGEVTRSGDGSSRDRRGGQEGRKEGLGNGRRNG